MTLRLCAVLTAAFALTVPAAAQARDLLDTTLTASTAQDRDCTTRLLGTRAQPTAKLTAPAGGWLTARLEGDGPGDWDLAIFEPETGRLVAGSAQTARSRPRRASSAPERRSRSRPAAAAARPPRPSSRYPRRGRGQDAGAGAAGQDLHPQPRPQHRAGEARARPHRARAPRLPRGRLYGAKDAQRLRDAKFSFGTRSRTWLRETEQLARPNQRPTSGPSGRTVTYRRLADYGEDMKKLVRENPGSRSALRQAGRTARPCRPRACARATTRFESPSSARGARPRRRR